MIRALMRLLLVSAMPGAVCTAAPLAVKGTFAPVDIKQTKLADGIYQFTVASDGYVEQLNSVAVITDTDVLLFDTTTRTSTARTILADLRKITPKPVRYLVNSHWHPDHWSGNSVFVDAFPNIEIIATERERDLMLNLAPYIDSYMPKEVPDAEKTVADLVASGRDDTGAPLTAAKKDELELELQRVRDLVTEQMQTRRVFPTLTYTDQLIFRHGGREFRFMSFTGDAAGDTVLYLPKEKILITGDAVSYPLPYFTPPLSEHSRSLHALAQLDADFVVPGHGPAFHDKSYMLLEASLFDEILRQVQAALRGGATSIDDVQVKMHLQSFQDRFANGDPEIAAQFPDFVKRMVRKAYIELRDSKEIR